MSQRKKIKKFNTFERLAYTDWHGDGEEFECEVCGEEMMHLQKKCPDCGTTYKFENGVLELYLPVVVKRKEPKSYSLPWYKPEQPEPIPVVHSWSIKTRLRNAWHKWRNK